jgi:hypothetical protein
MIVPCTYCQREINDHIETVWNQVEGWEKKRETGGTNHLALRTPKAIFCCNPCMTLLLDGLSPQQGTLV